MLIFPTYQTMLAKAAAASSGGGIVTSNLVLHLDANNYSGSGDWLDETSNDNDGTINGATYVAASGSDGAYFDFDGSNDYIKVDDSSDFLMGTGSFTEEAWHKRDGNNSWEAPFQRYSNPSWGGLWIDSSGNLYPYHYSNSGSNLSYNSQVTATTGWIHHVTTTTNTGSSVIIKIYKNNQLAGSQTTTVSSWQPKGTSVGDSDVYIGGTPTYKYDGKIAICRVYKGKALSATEIEQNYDAHKGRFGY